MTDEKKWATTGHEITMGALMENMKHAIDEKPELAKSRICVRNVAGDWDYSRSLGIKREGNVVTLYLDTDIVKGS